MRVGSIVPGDSPRLDGEKPTYVQMLADVDTKLPPILVHRKTMRVIDGLHRLRAAILKGEETIETRFFDGSAEMAFVVAVESNITNGLPLSLADRRAAAARISAAYPEWSDRAVAASTHLSPKTVRTIRDQLAAVGRRASVEDPQLNTRVGRDGRRRPLSFTEGRRRAAEVIAQRPDASLRDIASAAGVSTGTARDVRRRLRNGDDPAPPLHRREAGVGRSLNGRRLAVTGAGRRDVLAILANLRTDPSLRYTDDGKKLIRWLAAHAVDQSDWADVVDPIPPHCAYAVADFALGCAAAWQQLAEKLQSRAQAAE